MTFTNLMSKIAATDSSAVLNNVGPKQTPRLDEVIRFLSCNFETLKIQEKNRNIFDRKSSLCLDSYLFKCSIKILRIEKLMAGKRCTS